VGKRAVEKAAPWKSGFVNRNWPTFDHSIWPTPSVNQLSAPGRSEALRRP
jgi:hypothetical protein